MSVCMYKKNKIKRKEVKKSANKLSLKYKWFLIQIVFIRAINHKMSLYDKYLWNILKHMYCVIYIIYADIVCDVCDADLLSLWCSQVFQNNTTVWRGFSVPSWVSSSLLWSARPVTAARCDGDAGDPSSWRSVWACSWASPSFSTDHW